MSQYLICIFTLFMFVIALIYEAKMTDVLLTSHYGHHKITNEEQCLTKDACCYSVEVFDRILSDADTRYEGMLKPIHGGENQMWKEVTSGACLAGLTTSMRLAKAYRSNIELCGDLEPLPSTGLFSNFVATPMPLAWAVNQGSVNAQDILSLVNKGLSHAYGYAEADRTQSIFGIYNQYFEKTSGCVQEQVKAQLTTAESGLPIETFAIPIAVILSMLCCTFFATCCKSIPKPADPDGHDPEEDVLLPYADAEDEPIE